MKIIVIIIIIVIANIKIIIIIIASFNHVKAAACSSLHSPSSPNVYITATIVRPSATVLPFVAYVSNKVCLHHIVSPLPVHFCTILTAARPPSEV